MHRSWRVTEARASASASSIMRRLSSQSPVSHSIQAISARANTAGSEGK
jgi:hypothetical protein